MISAVVLSHNDCLNIERTLQSLIWCDEIIVVDDFSSDKTLETVHKVCKDIKFVPYKVFQRTLNDDFSAQRNFGLAKATGEWVLFVDSDEVVSKNLANEIKQVTSTSSSRVPPLTRDVAISPDCGACPERNEGSTSPRNDKLNGYYIKRQDFLFGKWLRYGETAGTKLLRLAKKDAGTWVRPVHEVWNIKGPTGVLKHPLLHFPHPNVAQFLSKINHYSTLNAQYFYKTNAPSHAWQILVYPKAKFFLNYIIRLGFLDGTQGFIFAILMSFHSFLTRGKLWLLHHKQEKISTGI